MSTLNKEKVLDLIKVVGFFQGVRKRISCKETVVFFGELNEDSGIQAKRIKS